MSGSDRATPDAVARASADRMWDGDACARALGMALEAVGPGFARIAMTVRGDMANGHGTAHGGMIFALADAAFAYACNSHGERAVAAHCAVTFLRPGRVGDRLVAEASEVAREGRSGLYDVTVRADGRTVAAFRGHSRVVGQN